MEEKKLALVVGMARSGVSVAYLLSKNGYFVRICDRKTEEELGETLTMLRGLKNVEYCLGKDPTELLDDVCLVVISPGIPIDHPVVKTARERGIEVVGELEIAYRYAKGRLIAITGTNGKTTTTTLTGEIFKNAGKITYVVGNIGFPYSAIAEDSRPEDVTVCEVSSFQLESIDTYHPSISAILNITPDHLNRHKTMETYIAMKARIFENQTPQDAVVLNYDDPELRTLAKQAKCRVIWFSRTQIPPFGSFVLNGKIVYGTPDEYRAVCEVSEIRIPGPHNLENALAASAIAMEAGVLPPVIRLALKTFKGVEHRLEPVRDLNGVHYINDSKGTNVDSTLKAIDSMTVPTVMIAGGSTKNVDMTPLAQALLGSHVYHVVLCGQTSEEIAEAFDRVGYTTYSRAGMDFEKAVHMAKDLAVDGGNVLLSPACASFDLFRDFEHRGEVFKQIVNAL